MLCVCVRILCVCVHISYTCIIITSETGDSTMQNIHQYWIRSCRERIQKFTDVTKNGDLNSKHLCAKKRGVNWTIQLGISRKKLRNTSRRALQPASLNVKSSEKIARNIRMSPTCNGNWPTQDSEFILDYLRVDVGQYTAPLVNIEMACKWMFISLKMCHNGYWPIPIWSYGGFLNWGYPFIRKKTF